MFHQLDLKMIFLFGMFYKASVFSTDFAKHKAILNT